MVSTIKLIATKLNLFINQGRRSNQLSEPNCEGRTAMDNLLPAYKAIGDHRYRETSGLYYRGFRARRRVRAPTGRTILEVDNTWFTLLTLNVQQLHFDAAYAAKTEWKKLACLTRPLRLRC